MTYTRKLYTYSRESGPGEAYEVYEQPRADRLRYLAFKAFWYATWKIKPVDWFIDNVLEESFDYVHKLRCDGDCVTVTTVATGEQRDICAPMPLSARLDCALYDFDVKNHRVVASIVVPRS